MTSIKSPLVHALWLSLTLLASTAAVAQEENAYLSHGADPVQREYSTAIMGFAYEKKCAFLSQSDRADYERQLNLATNLFEGYVLAMGMAPNPAQAVKYPRDMAMGAIRFAGASSCDGTARERVNRGFEVAKGFVQATAPALRKPLK
jgi:hypothetical protein